jgi:hypothetical protein
VNVNISDIFLYPIYSGGHRGHPKKIHLPKKQLQGPANGPNEIYKLYLKLVLKKEVLGLEGFG